jgi:hypothetical protein
MMNAVRMESRRRNPNKKDTMTIDPAVKIVSLLAGIDSATLNTAPVDSRAALSGLLAGLPAQMGERRVEAWPSVDVARPADVRDPRAG